MYSRKALMSFLARFLMRSFIILRHLTRWFLWMTSYLWTNSTILSLMISRTYLLGIAGFLIGEANCFWGDELFLRSWAFYFLRKPELVSMLMNLIWCVSSVSSIAWRDWSFRTEIGLATGLPLFSGVLSFWIFAAFFCLSSFSFSLACFCSSNFFYYLCIIDIRWVWTLSFWSLYSSTIGGSSLTGLLLAAFLNFSPPFFSASFCLALSAKSFYFYIPFSAICKYLCPFVPSLPRFFYTDRGSSDLYWPLFLWLNGESSFIKTESSFPFG